MSVFRAFQFLIGVGVLISGAIRPAFGDAFGAPGIPHRWAPAAKDAIGTAYEASGASSPVWFTLSQGILTEVFYPTVDQAQVGDLQFLVTDGGQFFSEQKRDTAPVVTYLDEGMTVHVQGEDRTGKYSYEQWIVTDPAAPVVRIHTEFHWNQPGLRVFVLFKPAISNTGAQNLASVSREGLFATKRIFSKGNVVTSAVVASVPFSVASAGYVGFSDGWQDLSRHFVLTQVSSEAGPGNVAMTGELAVGPDPDYTVDLALSFGSTRGEAETFATTSLDVPFEHVRTAYESGWKKYLRELDRNLSNKRFFTESPFARRSAEIIKMHEDKRNRGAIVASLSKPAIPDSDNAYDDVGGYHLVWPRDLYHAAMGLLAAGDRRTPVAALNYLVRTQRSDGSWPQNFWVDGSPYWHGLQMDEVSFPVLLALQLKSRGINSLNRDVREMVRRASSFIMSRGPTTEEDRWEEVGGYSPDTLATQIAALRAASILIRDPMPARVAEQWQMQIERWTLVPHGPWGESYYLRVSPSGQPDSAESIRLANGAGNAFASEILDGGFLNLVRMGVRDPRDPRILSTLALYESPNIGIASTGGEGQTPTPFTYRRYNRDAYGTNHLGGYWPVLAGEKGHYNVRAGKLDEAAAQLFVLEKSASEAGLIPEQTLGNSEAQKIGLGVAQPLVWAHAEDILLHRSIEDGDVFDAPRTP